MTEYINRQAAIDELMSIVERNRDKDDRFGGELIHWTGVKAILDCAPGIRFGWTRVSDELPPDDHRVLVLVKDESGRRYIAEGHRDGDTVMYWGTNEITHWMTWPELDEEDDNDVEK